VHFLQHVAALAWKDLRVEVRSGEILWNMTFFASMVVVVFSFAFLRGGELEAAMGPGVIWIAMAFAGSLGLARAFDREREGDTMRGLLLSPAPRAAIFLGKALAISVFILVVATVVTLLTWFLFEAPLLSHPLILALLLLLGAFGIAVVGSTFAGVLLRTRARDVLLPVVLYPLLVPLFLAGSKATGALMEDSVAGAWQWIRILVAYDALFLVVSLWSFESLVIE
jgi:heme exporter protein B